MVGVRTGTGAEQVSDNAAEAARASSIRLRSRDGAALVAATALASTVGSLNSYVILLAIPAIGRDLQASVSGLQWVVTSYLVTVAALLLPSGALADRLGRRRILITGLVTMLVSSVACAVAPTIGALIGARLVQGACAALVVPTSLALLNGGLRRSDRARGIGIWAGLATAGATVAPYAGGWLTDHASWRDVFLLNVPLILLALLVLRHAPAADMPRRARTFDVVGATLAVVGLGGVVHALTEGPISGWLSAPVLATSFAGVACLGLLLPIERRQREPMVVLSLFRSRQFLAINATTVLLYGGLATASYLLVLQCELQLGYSATAAGAILVPESAVFLALSPVSGSLTTRFGPRWLIFVGILTLALAFAWLSRAHHGEGYATTILPATLLLGLGEGLVATPLTTAVLAAADDGDLSEASAINNAAAWVGSALLIGVVPVLLGGGGRPISLAIAAGYRPAMLTLAGLCLVAAAISGRYVSNRLIAAPLMMPAPRIHGCPVVDEAGGP